MKTEKLSDCAFIGYCIQPNYRTVRLGFSKLLENTCGKICICLLKGTLKKDQQRTY